MFIEYPPKYKTKQKSKAYFTGMNRISRIDLKTNK
jgi:hypothetical protein